MKKRAAIFIAFAVGLVLLAAYAEKEKVPSLDVSQIERAYIYSRSGKDTAELTDDDMAMLLKKMAGVKLLGEGTEDFKNYDGIQYRMFYFDMKNGSKIAFSAGNPFYIIDAKWGFKCNYSDCDNLSQFYHSIVRQYFNTGVR